MSFPHLTGNSRGVSYWIDTTDSTAFPPLTGDARADVVVIGGGIAGITAAYLLAKAGRSVIVVDRERVAMAETGHTTAHLQIVVDTPLPDLVERFGLEGAKLTWDSQREAVELIQRIAAEEGIECELERLDAFLYAPKEEHRERLREQMRLAHEIGYPALEADPSEVPFPAVAAIRFPHQGKFHPRKYLLGLVERAVALGVRFHEGTEVVDVESGTPATVVTRDGHRITGDWVLHTSNVPFTVRLRMHTKNFPYRTYVIGARVPKGVFGHALYWDTLDPYHYTRIEHREDHDLVILGGEDHKVGDEEDTSQKYRKLEEHLRKVTSDFEVVYRWSGQINETEDDLPYIGLLPGGEPNELVATGFSGTGMTNGTIAAYMLCERILGRATPWDDLYDAQRATVKANPVKEWVTENLDVGKKLLGRTLMRSEVETLDELAPGDGAIVKVGLKAVAVSRTEDGRLCAVSGICTHVGCTVAWNRSEQSWDCPCHGSRFTPDGELLHGPAKSPLEPMDPDEVERHLSRGREAPESGRRNP